MIHSLSVLSVCQICFCVSSTVSCCHGFLDRKLPWFPECSYKFCIYSDSLTFCHKNLKHMLTFLKNVSQIALIVAIHRKAGSYLTHATHVVWWDNHIDLEKQQRHSGNMLCLSMLLVSAVLNWGQFPHPQPTMKVTWIFMVGGSNEYCFKIHTLKNSKVVQYASPIFYPNNISNNGRLLVNHSKYCFPLNCLTDNWITA